jgi:formate C-acetyltransferase
MDAHKRSEGHTAPVDAIRRLPLSERIKSLKRKTLEHERFLSIEQARLVTASYKRNEGAPRNLQRARALAFTLERISIRIDPEELIVGNRTADIRGGVAFPEAGVSWLAAEIDTLPTRPQDRFSVRDEDAAEFRDAILPYWEGKSLEDRIKAAVGPGVQRMERVVKINQKDHAQGHICPDVRKWLALGPAGLRREAEEFLLRARGEGGASGNGEGRRSSTPYEAVRAAGARKPGMSPTGVREFHEGVVTVLSAAQAFIRRYGRLAREMAQEAPSEPEKDNLLSIAGVCGNLAEKPPESFREALQSVWFLFVILQMESNASSFSPGRADQYLFPYLSRDLESGRLDLERALELVEAFWIKFNHIVYLRNAKSTRYFAGFPIGFNVALGGQTLDGKDASNTLSYLFLKAQDHLATPQPNLSARIHGGTPDILLEECSRVIGRGSGMPQIFNDESVIPALEARGIAHQDAVNYAVVGCVELSTHGNSLGWSDAAMFNMVKVLELTLNNGRCMLSGELIGLETGNLTDYRSFDELEEAFRVQLDHFIDRTMEACDFVDRMHAELLPSPFLSSVVHDCLARGLDVTAGGARYNLSGIQAIQVANLADSFAALKQCVFDEKTVEAGELLEALRSNFDGRERLRAYLQNQVPKYGNDVEWVDRLGFKWIEHFARRLSGFTNARGGPYHTGLYTVSAHVPMGKNVGATPDGRLAETPLADGGMSAMYGRDRNGPTALLRSVARLDSSLASNGTLLNMKFLPSFFNRREDLGKFASLLKAFVRLKIHHVQFNVVRKEDLIEARKQPEKYRGLTVRVAGYTAHYTELAEELQDEIIARTSYGG